MLRLFLAILMGLVALQARLPGGAAEAARLAASCLRDASGVVCDLRSDEALAIQSVAAFSSGQPVAAQFEAFDPAQRTTAWYFLIQQSSHPQDSVRSIERLVKHEGQRSYAIGSFLERLEERAAFGAGEAEIRRLRDSLTVVRDGRTNLYLSVTDALGKLADIKADRKALVVFADGTSATEDFRDRVPRAAAEANVLIYGVFMGRSGRFTAIRSLVDGVNGVYHESVPCQRNRTPVRCTDFEVSDAFATNFLGLLENGGTVRLPASTGAGELAFRVTYADGTTATAEHIVPRRVGLPLPDAAGRPVTSPVLQSSWGQLILDNIPATVRPYLPAWVLDNPVPTVAGAVSVLGLLLLGGILLAVKGRTVEPPPPVPAYEPPPQHEPAYHAPHNPHAEVEPPTWGDGSQSPGTEPEISPTGHAAGWSDGASQSGRPQMSIVSRPQVADRPILASLQFLDAKSTRIGIDATSVRIGRHPDNDVQLENLTVHRHHAVLHQTPSSRFAIRDLDTRNGIKVNGQPCRQHELTDGDLIELGEVRFRFHVAARGT